MNRKVVFMMKLTKDGRNFRIYGTKKQLSVDKECPYYEVEYKEYKADGTLYCVGTEDFSEKRLRTATKTYGIYTYRDTERRRTECSGGMRISLNAYAIRVAKFLFESKCGEIAKIL